MSETDLQKKIETYAELGKENPNVDVNMLMMSALKNEGSGNSVKSYRWPYLISLGVPPFGLFFVFKYYFSDSESDKQAAKICVFLTLVSLLSIFIFSKMIFSGSGASLNQIEQIKVQDIQQLNQ